MSVDGCYSIVFRGRLGEGAGMLVFQTGKVMGADYECVTYDGTYIGNAVSKTIDVSLNVNVPPNVQVVQGVSQPVPWSFPINATVPSGDVGKEYQITIQTPLGPINLAFKKLRIL